MIEDNELDFFVQFYLLRTTKVIFGNTLETLLLWATIMRDEKREEDKLQDEMMVLAQDFLIQC